MEDARARWWVPPVEKSVRLSREKPEATNQKILDKGICTATGLATACGAGTAALQVKYQYGPFKGFDMHENGGSRKHPIAQFNERGLLNHRGLVMILSTELGQRQCVRLPVRSLTPKCTAAKN